MEKPISFFAMNIILLFAAIGFIFVVFELHRFAFVFELMLLLVLFALFVFAMSAVYNDKQWGWTIAGAALILLIANLFIIYLYTGIFETAHLTALIFSATGIMAAMLQLRAGKHGKYVEEPEKSRQYYHYLDKMEPGKADEGAISKEFTPGKYIASKKAGKYHVARCDWAKKINSENQLWFGSEEEAKAQGFEADKCVA